jgi:hypothetical protein
MNQLAAVLLALALAGCGGSGGTSLPPCGAFPQIVTAPPMLLSPQPGATGVQTSGLSVAISYNPANDGTLRLVDAAGNTLTGSAFGPVVTPIPPGNTAAATAPPLAARTTYTVFVDAVYPPAARCTADARSGPTSFQVGSFTSA